MITAIILGAIGIYLLLMFPDMPEGGLMHWTMGGCLLVSFVIAWWNAGKAWRK